MTDDRIRVLWLIKGLGPGGAEQLLLEHARGGDHHRFAYEVAYLVPWKDHLVPALEEAGVTVHCLPSTRPWDVRWLAAFRRLVRVRRYDLVHVHSPLPAALARVLLRTLRSRPRLIYTEHNRWQRHARATRLLNRLTYRLDDHQLAVSSEVVSSMPARAARDVEVLHHGIDLARVRRASQERNRMRAEFDLAPDHVAICMVANYRREKNYATFLRAASHVIARTPRAMFFAVGQGPLREEIEGLHRTLGLDVRIRLLGYREDVPAVLSAMDVFTLTSVHEGLPVAVMEAMAAGLPVVAPAVGGIPEAVTDRTDGLVPSPGDDGALVDAYMTLVRDDALRTRLSEGASASAKRFDRSDAIRRIEAIYARRGDRPHCDSIGAHPRAP